MATDEGLRTLSYAVRPRVVAHYLGQLGLALALVSSVPLGVALATGELAVAAAMSASTALLGGGALALRRVRPAAQIQSNEALVVTAIVFVVAALLGAAPLAVAADLHFVDALFEAVSGVTTTGLSTLASVEGLPASFVFARAWMQWYGGFGFAALSIALLLGPGLGAHRLGLETIEREDVAGSFRLFARRMLLVYLALTAAGLVLVLLLGASPFDALVHVLAAVSTGGFSSHDASLAGLGSWRAGAGVVAVATAGAVSLPLWAGAWRRGPVALVRDVEVRALLLAGLGLTAALAAVLVGPGHSPASEAIRAAPLLALSAQTTTGFTPLPIAPLPAAAKLLLITAMVTGGSLGSTAGGLKLIRVIVALRVLQWLILRTRLASHAVAPIRVGGQPLGEHELERVLALFAVFAAVIVLSWLPFLLLGYDPLDSLFEVVSAVGTVGLSTGIAAPDLETGLKAVLCADMLLGRLEIVAFLVLLAPRTWVGRRVD